MVQRIKSLASLAKIFHIYFASVDVESLEQGLKVSVTDALW